MSRRNIRLLLVTAFISLLCYQKAGSARNRETDTIAEAMECIEQYYIDPIDRRTLFEAAMNGMTGALDPHSAYIPPTEFTEFQVSLEQHFGGIGIQVMLDDDGQLTVLSPLVGTPAYEAGVLAGDKIVAIDGQSTEGYRIEDAVRVLRGKPGTSVVLTLRRKGEPEPIEVEIRRAVIQVETVMGDTHRPDGSWNFTLEEYPTIGYIRITSFSEHTADELRKAVDGLLEQGIEGLILDLRNNPGGLLKTSIEVCDMFISQGVIVSTRGRGGIEREVFYAHAAGTYPDNFPMAVLVSRFSASASEIVAACLQDHGRAVIVGERTFGKGTVQNLFSLEQGRSALKLTVASYWRPSGQNIDRRPNATEDDAWGVTPDEGFARELSDDELRKLLEWRRQRDVVRAANAPPLPEPQPPASEVDPQLQLAIRAIRDAQTPPKAKKAEPKAAASGEQVR